MRLKDGFVTYETQDEHLLVPVGKHSFSGLVRSNETAAFLIEHLKEDTTKERLEQDLMNQYGIVRELASMDVEKVLEKLREIDALDE